MNMLLPRKFLAFTLTAIAYGATCVSAQDRSTPAMTLVVDETQAERRIAFVHEEIPVRPGTLALAYPRWIPGEHQADRHFAICGSNYLPGCYRVCLLRLSRRGGR